MKRIFILLVIICVSCNSEDAADCFQTNGSRETRTFEVPGFSKIRIEDNVNLRLSQGDINLVQVEAGGNLFTDISVEVIGNTLVVRSDNNCELVRDYDPIIAMVTVPDLKEIRNASTGEVRGEGVLNFTELELRSDTSAGPDDPKKSGDFNLHLDCENLLVAANGFSRFFIRGRATEAEIRFTDEVPLFEGANFEVGDLKVFQRSANIMRVNPVHSLRGSIRGTGDIIAVNRPDIVEVETFYTGRLIFED